MPALDAGPLLSYPFFLYMSASPRLQRIAARLTFLAAACAGLAAQPPGNALVITAITRPASLHPLLATDTVGSDICGLLFDSLVRRDSTAGVVPGLAESWTTSPDGRVWTFRLRRGVRFHDGVELTTRDVLYTYRAITDPGQRSSRSTLFRPIARMEAHGEQVLSIELKEPYAPLLDLLDVEILPAHLLDGGPVGAESFGRQPVGSGPFRLLRWEGNTVTLEANPDHFAGRPRLERVVVRSFPDRLHAWAALMRGEADAVQDLEFGDYQVIRNDRRFHTYDFDGGFYYTLLFNLDDPLFKDPRLRRALSLAVDRADLIAQALQGWGWPAAGPFQPGTWPCDASVAPDGFNPEESAVLLAEMGWKDVDGDRILERGGRELAFTLLIDRGDSIKERAARRLRWQLYQVGVHIDAEVADLQVFFDERLFPGRFQAALLQFNSSRDPDVWARSFWHSEAIGQSNLARYRSAEVDTLFQEGRSTSAFEARKAIYRRLHRVIAADRPALFLFFRREYVGLSARVGGIGAALPAFFPAVPRLYLRATGGEP